MSHVYQVTYVGPARYDEDRESDRAELRRVVAEFSAEFDSRHDGVIRTQTSELLGLFVVFTDTHEHAELLPLRFDRWERAYDVVSRAA